MKFVSSVVLAAILAFSAPLNSAPPEPTPVAANFEALQASAVTVVSSRGSGSGVIFLGSNRTAYCWTAFHVLGESKADVALVQQIVVNGRTVGFFTVMAEVISGCKTQDLAVLKPRSAYLFTKGAKFESATFIPKLGDRVFHVGSFLGLPGAQSFSSGEISYVGRVLDDGLVFDQLSNPCFPGSSGGPIFSAKGYVIGLVVSGYDATFSFCVPIRRMQAWARERGHPEWLGDSP